MQGSNNSVPNALVGNGYCNDITNNENCDYDGGDCCGSCLNTENCTECVCYGYIIGNGVHNALVQNGLCNDETNNAFCNYDGGDCCGDNVNIQHCSNCTCFPQETCASGECLLFLNPRSKVICLIG